MQPSPTGCKTRRNALLYNPQLSPQGLSVGGEEDLDSFGRQSTLVEDVPKAGWRPVGWMMGRVTAQQLNAQLNRVSTPTPGSLSASNGSVSDSRMLDQNRESVDQTGLTNVGWVEPAADDKELAERSYNEIGSFTMRK